MTPNELSERLLDFAVRVSRVVDALPRARMAGHVAGQLARSGTSPAPNYEEACAAESKKDFIHKLRVCLKELRESHLWLRFIVRANLLPSHNLTALIDETGQLCDIIGKSISTARKSME